MTRNEDLQVLREENKHLTCKARRDHPHYHDFLNKWFQSLSKTEVTDTYTQTRLKTEGMNTIDAYQKWITKNLGRRPSQVRFIWSENF